MSERMMWAGLWSLVVLLTFSCASILGHKYGLEQGRAEMKLWQDTYYQSHPVKPECNPPFRTHVELDEGLLYWVCMDEKLNKFEGGKPSMGQTLSPNPKPPKASKPVKEACPSVLVGTIGVFAGECWFPFDADSMKRIHFDPLPQCPEYCGGEHLGDIDPRGAACMAGSHDGHPIEVPCWNVPAQTFR